VIKMMDEGKTSFFCGVCGTRGGSLPLQFKCFERVTFAAYCNMLEGLSAAVAPLEEDVAAVRPRFCAELNGNIGQLIFAYLGPLPRFIVAARSVCRAWRTLVPLPLSREDFSSVRDLTSYPYLVLKRWNWTVGQTVTHLVQMEPDHCCSGMGRVMRRFLGMSATTRTDEGVLTPVAVLHQAVEKGKIALVELFLRCLNSTSDTSPDSPLGRNTSFTILQFAIRTGRSDVLRHFAQSLWTLPVAKRSNLFFEALYEADEPTFCTLMKLDMVDVQHLPDLFTDSSHTYKVYRLGTNFCYNIRLLRSLGAPDSFFEQWTDCVKERKFDRSQAVALFVMRSAVAICAALQTNPTHLCAFLTKHKKHDMHAALSSRCGCQVIEVQAPPAPQWENVPEEEEAASSEHEDNEEEDEGDEDEDEEPAGGIPNGAMSLTEMTGRFHSREIHRREAERQARHRRNKRMRPDPIDELFQNPNGASF